MKVTVRKIICIRSRVEIMLLITDPQDPDSDNDGLLDGAEYFGDEDNTLWDESTQDYTGENYDGISNPNNYITDPLNCEVSSETSEPSQLPVAPGPDGDVDVLEDGWEVEHSSAPYHWISPFSEEELINARNFCGASEREGTPGASVDGDDDDADDIFIADKYKQEEANEYGISYTLTSLFLGNRYLSIRGFT
jgi:hypothetical protein